jgi:hypothetical protein
VTKQISSCLIKTNISTAIFPNEFPSWFIIYELPNGTNKRSAEAKASLSGFKCDLLNAGSFMFFLSNQAPPAHNEYSHCTPLWRRKGKEIDAIYLLG